MPRSCTAGGRSCVRGPDQSGAWYKASYWTGKFLTPFFPGAAGAGAGGKALAKPGGVSKVVKGALGRLFSGTAQKAAPPKVAPRIVPRADVSPRGIGGKSAPAVEVQKAPTRWTHAGQMEKASSQVADFALKHASKRRASKTYVGGYNIETGDIALAQSGGCKPGLGFCAEGNAVRALGGDPTKVRFTIVYNVDFGNGVRTVKPKEVCVQCQLDYPSPGQFEPGAKGESGGLWDELGY
ncbi:hypothetical protein ACIRP4_05215 [Streptomyces bacillaris]|uniref:hypothetical protein n=1 Tax=Streptomyces bacillaris TaxID=68179 RepID=UPI0037FDEF46